MFGFGPMSSFYDDDFEDDGFDPTEPFSQDEFVTHNDRELRNLDASREEWDDDEEEDNEDFEDFDCPRCGNAVRCHIHAPFARCRKCGTKF